MCVGPGTAASVPAGGQSRRSAQTAVHHPRLEGLTAVPQVPCLLTGTLLPDDLHQPLHAAPSQLHGSPVRPAQPGGSQNVSAQPGGLQTLSAQPGGLQTLSTQPGGSQNIPTQPGGL